MSQIGRAYTYLSEASTNIKKVKSTDGVVYRAIVSNLSAETRYVKLYDSAETPNLASAKPFATIPVPKESIIPVLLEYPFQNSLWHAITKGAADTNSEAVSAGDVRVSITTS